MRKSWFFLILIMTSCQLQKDSWVRLSDGSQVKLARNETISTVMNSEPPSLDWLTSSDTDSSWLEEHLMNGLVGFDLTSPQLKLVPALATHWELSEQGLVWTFHLRDNVKWSDGILFSSKHVIDGFRRILDPNVAAIAVDNIFPIKGAREFNEGKFSDFSKVGVKALDKKTIQFTLKKPMSFFPMLLAHHTTFPIRQDVVDKHQELWTEPENIVTLGPYKLMHWHHDSRLVLTRNEGYWGEAPKIKNVIFYIVGKDSTKLRMFERGKIDLIKDLPSAEIPRLSQKPEFHTLPGLRLYYYGLKVNKKPFDNKKVRQAFNHAIDRSEIVKVLGGGQVPLKSWVPSGMFGHNDQVGLSFDVPRAQQLLREAGYTEQNSLPPIILGFNTEEKHQRVAENIQAQLKKNLKISIELKNEEWKTFLNGLRSESAYSLFRFGWVADYADPHNFMAIMTSFSANNRTGWKNKEYDELILQGLQEMNPEKRLDHYRKAQKILVEDEIPVIPILTDVNQVLVNQRVLGYHDNVLDMYHFHKMELKQ